MSKRKIRMALIYDFDGTLAEGYMQNYNFFPDIGKKPKEFWAEVHDKTSKEQADEILVYMSLMLKEASHANKRFTKDALRGYGKKIPLFNGVNDWFKNINSYANTRNVKIEHYLISSGNAEIIQGTDIAKEFSPQNIFASKYLFDQNGAAEWPALAVNYTAKTQFLFRINKGISDISDNATVNKFIPKDERPMPFENMIFIGDGETDIPCFKLVKDSGGMSIAVYQPHGHKAKEKAEQYLHGSRRVDIVAPADYSKGKKIYKTVCRRIDLIVAKHDLQKIIKS